MDMFLRKTSSVGRKAKAAAAALCVWCGLAFLFLNDQVTDTDTSRSMRNARKRLQEVFTVKPYTREDIIKTQEMFVPETANLLMIFDSESGKFFTHYDGGAVHYSKRRPEGANAIMASALYSFFPNRFKPGSPPFQILFSADDYPTIDLQKIDLTQAKVTAGGKTFAPVLQFGSVPRDEHMLDPVPIIEMPFAKIMPCFATRALNKEHGLGRCLFDDSETLKSLIHGGDADVPSWDDLKPQIVWRGADYQFLERFYLGTYFGHRALVTFTTPDFTTPQSILESFFNVWDYLIPRWKAVTLSLKAKLDAAQEVGVNGEETLPWLDIKFFEKTGSSKWFRLIEPAGMTTSEFMTHEEQTMYKYHIDFAGGGGTSWTGTLSKLAMPGVLFHHETIMRDFYYDQIRPWEHYIPVKQDLSDLREHFDWAEANPDKARAISEAASKFVQTMDTGRWFKKMYRHYFKEQLGNVVDAYVPSDGETLHSNVEAFREIAPQLKVFSECDDKICFRPSEGYGIDFQQGAKVYLEDSIVE